MVAFKCLESKEKITVLTLAFRLYHSLTPWSTQREGELIFTSVKIPEVHPVGSRGLVSMSNHFQNSLEGKAFTLITSDLQPRDAVWKA